MKKDRVVGICICVLLLGHFQAQQIAGIWQLAPPSLPHIIWAAATGKPLGFAGRIRTPADRLPSLGRPGFVGAVVHAGWPQLGFVYDEILLLSGKLKNASDRDEWKRDPGWERTRPSGKNHARPGSRTSTKVLLKSLDSMDSVAFSLLSLLFPEY